MAPPPKSVILAEVQRLASENGGVPLGRERFSRVTGIKESDWSGRYWTRWGDALVEAGFEPNKWNEAWPDDELLDALARLALSLGRFPTHAERKQARFNDPAFPTANSFSRLGNRDGLVSRLYAFCAEREDLSAVLPLLAPLMTAMRPDPSADPAEGAAASASGYVYLVKSGRHYKIGRSNHAGRRFYEIGLQLPERLEVVHFFETDDPAGIERYWHERFADRRANGEWFNLTAADVRAFQRRKSFM